MKGLKMSLIEETLQKANFNFSFAEKLNIISIVSLRVLVVKLSIFFAKTEKRQIVPEFKNLAEQLFTTEWAIRDYYYKHPQIELPLIFGISLKRTGNKITAEFYLNYIYKKQKKVFEFKELNQYLPENKEVKLINNQILNNFILTKEQQMKLISILTSLSEFPYRQ